MNTQVFENIFVSLKLRFSRKIELQIRLPYIFPKIRGIRERVVEFLNRNGKKRHISFPFFKRAQSWGHGASSAATEKNLCIEQKIDLEVPLFQSPSS